MKLSRLGEFGLIDRLQRTVATHRGVHIGIGDDAAWVEHPDGTSLITADLMIEGIHFDLKWTSLQDLGYKSLAVNLSDIAAMGGAPAYVILSLGIPSSFDSNQVDQLYRGINALARKNHVTVVGGDTSIADSLIISVCVIGHPPKRPVRRSGAQIGDDIYVTGTLGDSALGLRILQGRSRRAKSGFNAQLVRRHHRPTPRLAAGALLGKNFLATAMIDISDGLLQDLGHVCKAGRVGAVIWNNALPLSPAYKALAGEEDTQIALSGGEDYELLFFSRPKQRRRIVNLQNPAKVAITRIGTCIAAEKGITIVDVSGKPVFVRRQGHDHFKKQ